MWQVIIGTGLAIALGALLTRHAIASSRRRRAESGRLLDAAAALFEQSRISEGATAGTHVLTGRYRGSDAEVKMVADTLPLRKLPSLWLMVTLPGPLPVKATLDLMMRPAGPTTFSNFDHLSVTVPTPAGFPKDAVIRTDDAIQMPDPGLVARHLRHFEGRHGKELLITPKGLRIVMLAGEADRARYGVFRQADFSDITVAPDMIADCLDLLMDLRDDIKAWHRNPA